jgi:Subtilase family
MRRALVITLAAVAVVIAAIAARPASSASPNDPGWSGEWGIRLMRIPAVWAVKTFTHPVIATVDTGANTSFPDLRNVIVPGWNLVDDNSDSSDAAGHGTDVALVIAANLGNGYGLAGACPMCRVMPVKISADGNASPTMIAAGIRWAVNHGARIITISLVATGAADPDEQAAVDYAGARGAVVLASAGNDGSTALHYPAALQGVVSIAATDANDALYSWSTRGNWVDLAVPGCIYKETMCGTSYAPPLVAAAIGVLTAAGPAVTPLQAVNALRATAVPVSGISGGRIDVRAAADALGIPWAVVVDDKSPSSGAGRQVRIESGTFAVDFRTTLNVAAGPLTVLLSRGDARSCTMSLRSADAVYLTWLTTPNELDISTRVDAGRYALVVHCAGSRQRHYSLFVTARFPSG